MKLINLSFSIFCGAKWGELKIEVLGISREQCLEVALNECTAIDLYKSCGWNKTVTVADYDAVPQTAGSMWYNKDFELFKMNPEKYVDFDWDEIELPYVVVN